MYNKIINYNLVVLEIFLVEYRQYWREMPPFGCKMNITECGMPTLGAHHRHSSGLHTPCTRGRPVRTLAQLGLRPPRARNRSRLIILGVIHRHMVDIANKRTGWAAIDAIGEMASREGGNEHPDASCMRQDRTGSTHGDWRSPMPVRRPTFLATDRPRLKPRSGSAAASFESPRMSKGHHQPPFQGCSNTLQTQSQATPISIARKSKLLMRRCPCFRTASCRNFRTV